METTGDKTTWIHSFIYLLLLHHKEISKHHSQSNPEQSISAQHMPGLSLTYSPQTIFQWYTALICQYNSLFDVMSIEEIQDIPVQKLPWCLNLLSYLLTETEKGQESEGIKFNSNTHHKDKQNRTKLNKAHSCVCFIQFSKHYQKLLQSLPCTFVSHIQEWN